MNLPDYMEKVDGEIRLTGHRLGLFHVVDRYQDGHSPEMIGEEFPTLPLALIYRTLAFYLDHQEEVNVYVHDYRNALERQEAEHSLLFVVASPHPPTARPNVE